MSTVEDFNEVEMASELASEEVKVIPLSLIERSEVALRDVNTDSEEFQNLKASIADKGVLNSILVKKIPLPGMEGVDKYALIDGLQRYTASLHCGRETIPARIVDMDEGEILEAQIITNVNRIATKPAQYAQHLLRMLTRNPAWTLDDLAKKVSQSRTWVEKTLSLVNLVDEVKKLVDNGEIKLSNAYVLSKLPQEEQPQHVQAAMSEPHTTFLPRMNERIDQIKKAKREGRSVEKAEWKPTMSIRKAGEVKSECEALCGGDYDKSSIAKYLSENDVTAPEDVAKYCLAWVCNFDEESQKQQKIKHEASVKARKEEAERRKKEKEAQKAELAAKKQLDLTNY